jgi:SAM-dependent methyltransferase
VKRKEEPPPRAATRPRRSLSHVGGAPDFGGDRAFALLLAHALDVAPALAQRGTDGEDRAHVHGFHTYPARMHPVTAARLIEVFAPPGSVVLDPFCGSGTVLVEAMGLGRAARGTDLNPLAVKLAATKTRARSPRELDELVAAARRAAAFAEARRKARAGATRRYPKEDVATFDPHVLLELDGIRAGVCEESEPIRGDLLVVLSSILVKLSRQRADTSEQKGPRRLAAGYPSTLFVKKTTELAGRLRRFEELLSSPRPPVRVAVDDALHLPSVPDQCIDLVLTSPPYAGTYDYLAHHGLRMRWLGLDARGLERGEMGARRRYAELDGKAAEEAWRRELEGLLASLQRVLRRGAFLVLLIGDSAVGNLALRADDLVADAAEVTRLERVARSSQARPHFHGPSAAAFRDAPRREHALLLRRR